MKTVMSIEFIFDTNEKLFYETLAGIIQSGLHKEGFETELIYPTDTQSHTIVIAKEIQ